MAEFPAHPAAVTPEWLTARLRDAGLLQAGAVTAVAWQPIGTGQVGDSARFSLTYDRIDAGPATLAGKFPAVDPMSRGTAASFGLYRKEVGFYRELRPLLEVRAPEIYAAEIADDGIDFVLLFEDLGPARGGDQIAGCSLADARAGIAQAAALHAPSWDNPDVIGREWLIPPDGASAQIRLLYTQAQAIFRERYADALEPEYMALCEALEESGDAWFGRPHGGRALIHGDFRLDNMLFDIRGGAEPIAVLDWQTVAVGDPMTDIGYFLGCGIGPTLSRAHEDELLALYLTEMAARGVHLTREAVWDDYRRGALHGVSTAVFSAAFVERTERGDANFLSMARGACDLALRHDSIAALKELG